MTERSLLASLRSLLAGLRHAIAPPVTAAAETLDFGPLEERILLSASPLAAAVGDAGQSLVLKDADGGSVAIWAEDGADDRDIFAQWFGADGAAHGGPVQVNQQAHGDQWDPAAALTDDGTLLVAWKSQGEAAETGVFATHLTRDGATAAEIALSNELPADGHLGLAVGDEQSIVAWGVTDQAGTAIRAVRLTDGAARDPFLVGHSALADGVDPHVEWAETGFTISWNSLSPEGPSAVIHQYGPADGLVESHEVSLLSSSLPTASAAPPLGFEINSGQTDAAVDYLARGDNFAVFLADADATLVLDGGEAAHALRMDVLGTDGGAAALGLDKLDGQSHYLVGDSRLWLTGVEQYATIEYHDIYDGIDLRYYGNDRALEYDFHIRPGGSVDAIRFRFEGAEAYTVDAAGDLLLSLGGDDVRFRAPVAYQQAEGETVAVDSRYTIGEDGVVGFVVGAYDPTRTLVIDPILDYGTYLGGTGADEARAVAHDGAGNAYIVGRTASAAFPTTVGALDRTHAGSNDVFVAKLNAAGTALVYSTFLGGSGDDGGEGIAVNTDGEAFVVGYTASADFATTAGGYDTTSNGGQDAFLVRLNAAGSGLVYSSYFGGSGNDAAHAVALDAAGGVYIAAGTTSNNLPTTAGAYDAALAGPSDAVLARFNTGVAGAGSLVYSTYFGGSGNETAYGVVVDGSGQAAIAGDTSSNDLPTTASGYDRAANGGTDGFLAKFDAAGTALLYGTWLGGSGNDSIQALAIDASGDLYVAGYTASNNLPATAGAYDTTYNGGTDAFVARFDPDLAGAASLGYATYLGESNDDRAYGIAVDADGQTHVVGYTRSTDFPTTAGMTDNSLDGGQDAFYARFGSAGSQLNYATLLGGGGTETAYGVAVTSAGAAYVVGLSASTDFPTTVGAYDGSSNGGNDGFAARFSPAAESFGSEFRANTAIGDAQTTPAVASDALGRYVVVWTSNNQDGSREGVYAQRYAADGTPLAGEFRVNATTAAEQLAPAVAMNGAGDFVVVWQSKDQDGNNWGIFAQRYNAAGVAQGGEFLVNQTTAAEQLEPAVAIDSAGNFVVAWASNNQDGDRYGVYARRYSAAGVALGGEFLVNQVTANDQRAPAVAIDADGDFVVAWQSKDQDGDNWGIYARRYNAVGAAQGAEFLVNTRTAKEEVDPSVGMDAAGNFVIAWASNDQDTSNYGVYAQRFDAAGAKLGGEFRATTYVGDAQDSPAVAVDAATGNFLIVWASNNQDGDQHGVYGQLYDAEGSAVGNESRFNTTTTNQQLSPAAAFAGGQFVAVWQGNGPGDGGGVFGQLFTDGLNQPPLNNLPGAQTLAEDATLTFSTAGGNSISIADPDGAAVQVTLTLAGGTLSLDGVAGLSFSNGDGTADAAMTFSGTIAAVNAALDGAVFAATADYYGPATLRIVSGDLGNTGLGGPQTDDDTLAITIAPVNDAPTNNVPGLQSTTEGSPLVFSSATGNAIGTSDVDAAGGSLRITLTATGGTLKLASTTGLTFSAGDGIDDATMTFTATSAYVDAALSALRFTPDSGFSGQASVTLTTSDQGNTGSGGAKSDSDTVEVNVASSHALWLGTRGIVAAPSGVAGVVAWTQGTILEHEGLLEPAGTSGPFSTTFTLSAFAMDGTARINALEYVNHDIVVGVSTQFALHAGDLLLSIADLNEWLPGVGMIHDEDVIVFRPTTPGDYSAGAFFMLLDDLAAGGDVEGIALIEHDVWVGDAHLSAGTFLYSVEGAGIEDKIYLFTPDGVGEGTTSGASAVLISGADIGYLNKVMTVEIIDETITVGGRTLSAGRLLATEESSSVVWELNVSQTTLVGGTTVLNATQIFVGGEAGFDTAAEQLDAVAIAHHHASNGSPTAAADSYAVAEGGSVTRAAPGVLVNDNDPDGDPLVAALASGPSHAAAFSFNANGSFSYTHDGGEATNDSFSYFVSDGRGGLDVAVVRLSISAVNDAPTLDLDPDGSSGQPGSDFAAAFAEGSSGVRIADGDAQISDADDTLLDGLTIWIDNPGDGAAERLVADVAGTGITATYTAATHTLVLSGSDTLAHYNQVLRTVEYQNTSQNPAAHVRSIRVQADDGSATSAVAVCHTSVTPVNGPPLLDLDANDSSGRAGVDFITNFTEGAGPVLLADTDATLTDADSAYLESLTVRITSLFDGTAEILSANTAGTAVVASYDAATGTLLLSGTDTLAHYRQILATVAYDNLSANPTLADRQISFVAAGAWASSEAATATVTMSGQNDPPHIDLDADDSRAPGSGFSTDYWEGAAGVAIADADAALGDVDTAMLARLTATIDDLRDGVAESLAADTAGTSITAAYDAATGTLTLAGADTVASYQQVLRTIRYQNTDEAPDATPRQITLVVNDGTADSAAVIATVAIHAVNDAPVQTLPASGQTDEDGRLEFSAAAGRAIRLEDVDAGDLPLLVSLSAENGVLTLATTDGLTFVAGDGVDDAAIVVGGTLADLNAALEGLAFRPTPHYYGPAAVYLTTTDGGAQGDGGEGIAAGSISIDVRHVNHAPLAAGEAYTTDVRGLIVFGPGLLHNDADPDAGDALAVVLVGGPAHGRLVLDADGSFAYYPDAGHSGDDSFRYVVSDGLLESQPVEVVVHTEAVVALPPPASGAAAEGSSEATEDGDAEESEKAPVAFDPNQRREPPPSARPATVVVGAGPAAASEQEAASDPAADEVLAEAEAGRTAAWVAAAQARPSADDADGPKAAAAADQAPPAVVGLPTNLPEEPAEAVLGRELDQLAGDLNEATQQSGLTIATVTSLTAAFSVGYAMWTIRGGYLVASFLASAPAWTLVDPIPILDFDDVEPRRKRAGELHLDNVERLFDSRQDT